MGRSQLCAPYRNMHFPGSHYTHITIKPGSGIPAGRLRFVFQTNSKSIVLTVFIQKRSDIAMERIITERPETGFLPIDVDTGFTHSAIEDKSGLLIGCDIKGCTVPADTHIRKPACAPGLDGSFLLEVLRYRHFLQVVAAVERTEDGPVVRHGYGFPLAVVKLRFHGFRNVAFGEFPVLLKKRLAALRLQGGSK